MNTDFSHITSTQQLKEEILNLRIRSERQKEGIHSSVQDLKASVRPMNLLRQAAGAISRHGKNNEVVQTLLGLGGGALAKNVLFGRQKGLMNRIWSASAKMLLTKMLSKKTVHKTPVREQRVRYFAAPQRTQDLRPVFDEPGQAYSPSLRATATPWMAETMELPSGNLRQGRYNDEIYQTPARQVF